MNFLHSFATAGLVGWLLVTSVWATAPVRPNLLIIQTDEHNFRTLGCYRDTLSRQQAEMWGPAVLATPHLDRLARSGAICTSFYATTPVCSPSRAALVSGRYPQHTDVSTNNIPLRESTVTFAELLRRRGYATGFAGKWHLAGTGKPQWAPPKSFGFTDNRYMFNRGHWKQLADGPQGPRVAARDARNRPSYSIEGATPENFTTDFLTDRAIAFVKRHAGKPFCFYLSLPDPHGPDTVRPPYDTLFADRDFRRPRTFSPRPSQIPGWGQPAPSGTVSQAKYYGMVKCIDDNVGRLLAALKECRVERDTIVVFTSDHGDLRGEHHRQNKGIPYEGSARIPFLLAYPAKVPPATRIDVALSCVDFQPTVLELMGCEPSGHEQGRNAAALFRGESPEDWEDVAFLRGTGTRQGWLTVVSDRYKLVFAPNDMPWLFDLERDPDELTNFFAHAGYREIVQRLATRLRGYENRVGDPFLQHPLVKADVEWAATGSGEYPGRK